MIFETERLILREYTMDDLDDLYAILSDPESMKYYTSVYSKEKAIRWINWSCENYQKYGFGLWAIELKATGEYIGDCGITMQNIDSNTLPEIGFHINKRFTQKGFATEAGLCCLNYFFNNFDYPAIYCYQTANNLPSRKTALKLGLRFLKEYIDVDQELVSVYTLTKEEYKKKSR